MYHYLILNDQGSIVFADPDQDHTKQLALVLTMRTGRQHYVDTMLTSLCDI